MKTILIFVLLLVCGVGAGKLVFWGFGKFRHRNDPPAAVATPVVPAVAAMPGPSIGAIGPKVGPVVVDVPLRVRGVVLQRRYLRVYLTDGQVLHGEDGRVELVQADRVKVDGKWLSFVSPFNRAIPAVPVAVAGSAGAGP